MRSEPSASALPRVVLICHEQDRIDSLGLSAWLASTMNLVGVIRIRERPGRTLARARREIRRVGALRFLDVLAFRAYYRIRVSRRDSEWAEDELARLRARYPADPSDSATLVVENPNCEAARKFLESVRPEMMVARCKVLLKPEIFGIPTRGTYVLHPGICPEYRNAHGCFWALANRDLSRVGMTLLRVDEGVDTGPVLLQASYRFDERRESPAVMQYRVVLENLDRIAACLMNAWRGNPRSIPVTGRKSAAWGQPWLTAYLRWRHRVRGAMQ